MLGGTTALNFESKEDPGTPDKSLWQQRGSEKEGLGVCKGKDVYFESTSHLE